MVEDNEAILDAVTVLVPQVLRVMGAFETVQRHLHPPNFAQLTAAVAPLQPELQQALDAFQKVDWPDDLTGFSQHLATAANFALEALNGFQFDEHDPNAFVHLLRAMRRHIRAAETLYPFCPVLKPVNRFFLEEPLRESDPMLAKLTQAMNTPPADIETGIISVENERDKRGGFSMYVPEYYDAAQTWPLVVAMHGGSGHGADFLWTWLREARSRGFILIAPTSQGNTWSLMEEDIDAAPIRAMVEQIQHRWHIDAEKILLTGMSDGATYSLLCGLQEGMPFTAFAPISGVLHPANFMNGNVNRIQNRKIYLAHGALDWMFPIDTARTANEQLLSVGADLTYSEIPDLSHTYPRDENAKILDWFGLKLPGE